ncbi:MAG: hypothetical protein WD182_09270 [Bacteroidota bacterium]
MKKHFYPTYEHSKMKFTLNKKREVGATMTGEFMFDLSILLIKEGKIWAAQCLEFDIAAQGKTREKAKRAFEKTLVGQLILDAKYAKTPFEGIPRAPKMYWDMLEKTKSHQQRKPIYLPEKVPSIRAAANYLQPA